MPKLVYTVELDSGDPEDDLAYLQTLQRLFRIVSEELPSWGFSGDETLSHSTIENGDMSHHSVRADLH